MAARRDGAQQGQNIERKESVWPSMNEALTGTLEHRRPTTVQTISSRIRKEKHERLGKEHVGEDGRAKEPATKEEKNCPEGTIRLLNVVRGPRLAVGLLHARGKKNEKDDGSEKSDLWAVLHLQRRDGWRVLNCRTQMVNSPDEATKTQRRDQVLVIDQRWILFSYINWETRTRKKPGLGTFQQEL